MNWLHVALSVIAGMGSALVAYGIVVTHGNPRAVVGDYELAFRLIPLELLLGLLVGVVVFRAFGRRATLPPRTDVAERMVLRLAMRRGGRFTLEDLQGASPLNDTAAREALARLVSSGRVTEDAGRYQLR